jgi:hypothetical protein
MFIERGVQPKDLVLVRRVAPCKAVLKIGDKVRLNSGSPAVPVIAINGSNVTVELERWMGGFRVTLPRACFQKATIWNWLQWKALAAKKVFLLFR